MHRARTNSLTVDRVHERIKADKLASNQLIATLDSDGLQKLIDIDSKALSEVQKELHNLMRNAGSTPSLDEQNEIATLYTRIAKQVARLRHEKAARDDFFCGTL